MRRDLLRGCDDDASIYAKRSSDFGRGHLKWAAEDDAIRFDRQSVAQERFNDEAAGGAAGEVFLNGFPHGAEIGMNE